MKKISKTMVFVLCFVLFTLFFSACGPGFTYSGSSLAVGTVGVLYEQAIDKAEGGSGETEYVLKEGSSLPEGLEIIDGKITGIPLAKTDGAKSFSIVAVFGEKTAEAGFSITINSGSLIFTGSHFIAAYNKESNLSVATATGGGKAVTYAISGGELPTGLELNSDGKLTGTATKLGEEKNFTVTASSPDCASASASFSIEVSYSEALDFSGDTLPAAEVSVSYGYQLKVDTVFNTSVTVIYSIKEGSNLPAGLDMDEYGYISGKPTAAGSDLTFIIIASAEGYRPAEAKFTMNVRRAQPVEYEGEIIGFESKSLAEAYAYETYSATGTNSVAMKRSYASNNAPVTYALKNSAQLPESFVLSANGDLRRNIKLARTEIGTYNFTVIASAEQCAPVEADFTLIINKPKPAAPKWFDLPKATVGSFYSDSVAKAAPHSDDGSINANFTYKVKSNTSTLSYFTLNANGTLSGTPDKSVKSFTYTITVSSDFYADITMEATILVRDPVTVVNNGVLEAEYVDLENFQGAGDSSNPSGEGVIQSAADENVIGVSNGYFVGYTHRLDEKLTFIFNSSQAAAAASLTLRLASERRDLTINPSSLVIKVNGVALSYNQFTVSGTKTAGSNFSAFTDYSISAGFALKNGENTIEITIGALTGGSGTLLGAPAFDCIKIGNLGGTQLSWSPCKYNLVNFEG